MLVLRRKVDESLVLAGVITISVLAIEGEYVKIGISAPLDVTMLREEVSDLLKTGQEASPAPNEKAYGKKTGAASRTRWSDQAKKDFLVALILSIWGVGLLLNPATSVWSLIPGALAAVLMYRGYCYGNQPSLQL